MTNAQLPFIVTATVSLDVYIVAEATLSFLGIGLPPSVVSWGNDIAAAQPQVRSGNNLHVLFFPAGALALTVLSFMLLGDEIGRASCRERVLRKAFAESYKEKSKQRRMANDRDHNDTS